MPSPFRRKSGQIQPMSQAELDASLAETAALEAEDEGEGIFISHNPSESDQWGIHPTLGTRKSTLTSFGFPEGRGVYYDNKATAEREAQHLAGRLNIPYLGER